MEPTLSVIIDSNDSYLRDYHWDLINLAVKDHGWTPGEGQIDNLAAQMYVLPRRGRMGYRTLPIYLKVDSIDDEVLKFAHIVVGGLPCCLLFA